MGKQVRKLGIAACIGGVVAAAVNSAILLAFTPYVRYGGMLLRERVTIPQAVVASLAVAFGLSVLLLVVRRLARKGDAVFCTVFRILLAAAVIAPVFMDIDTVKSRVVVGVMHAVAGISTMLALRMKGGFRPR